MSNVVKKQIANRTLPTLGGTGVTTESENASQSTPVSSSSTTGNYNVGTYSTQQYQESDKSKQAQEQAQQSLDKYKGVVNKYSNGTVSQDTWDAINSKFSMSENTLNALSQLNSSIEALRSGRTSYSDKVDSMINQIANRESFSYDPSSDALFQNALGSAMANGNTAMQNTMGQASALTGGYGSSYATASANQAYNNQVQSAYNNLPEFYNMALAQYQSEGNDMYNLLGAYQNADETAYNRMLNNYNIDYNQYNNLYDKDYNSWLSAVNTAISKAGLEMQEADQITSNAYNEYALGQTLADNLYNREYTQYLNDVSQSQWAQGMTQTDYWNAVSARQNDDTLNENKRQFNENLAENKRQYDSTLEENQRQYNTSLLENQRQYNLNLLENQRQFNLGFEEGARQFDATLGEKIREFDLSTEEGIRQFNEQMKFNYADLAQQDEQFNKNLEQNASQFAQNLQLNYDELSQKQSQFEAEQAQNQSQFEQNLAYDYSKLSQAQAQFEAEQAQNQSQFDATLAYNKTQAEAKAQASANEHSDAWTKNEEKYKTNAEKALKLGGEDELVKYIESIESGLTDDEILALTEFAHKYAGTDSENAITRNTVALYNLFK